MSDYYPTTSELRAFCSSDRNDALKNAVEHHLMRVDGSLAFDRWLAEHDARIAKQTEDRIIELLEDEGSDTFSLAYLIALIKGENE